MKDVTDGQIALIVNSIYRSMHQISTLGNRFSPAVAASRAEKLDSKVTALIERIEVSNHIGAKEIAESIRQDVAEERIQFITAGARRFFNFPLNWSIRNGEVVMPAAVEAAKKAAKARKQTVRKPSLRRHEFRPR